jgi:hypothetical protein
MKGKYIDTIAIIIAMSEPIISKLKLNKFKIDTGLNTFSQAMILTIMLDQIGTINKAT